MVIQVWLSILLEDGRPEAMSNKVFPGICIPAVIADVPRSSIGLDRPFA